MVSSVILRPLVSVVIPAYNQARYLAGAVESVCKQTYRPFEIVLVDDGSTDETASIARQFGDLVRYVWQSNQGLAVARNTGIQTAHGKWVALLDSDDEWRPQHLETMVALAEGTSGADIFYCPVTYMDSDGQDLPQQPDFPQVPPQDLYWFLLRKNFLVPSTILMRRSVVDKDGPFDPAFRRLQDWELWLRLLRSGRRFEGCPERMVRYRVHGSSLSTDSQGGEQAVRAMVYKLFGPEDGDLRTWPADKRRAWGGVYRYAAIAAAQHRQDWNACGKALRSGMAIDASLAEDVSLFYELALGSQPMGYRGLASRQEHRLGLDANAAGLAGAMAVTFARPLPVGLNGLRRPTFGSAHRAMGMAAYNLKQFAAARKHLLHAIRFTPGLALDGQFSGTLLKAFLGGSLVSRIRHLRKQREREPGLQNSN